jgi:hypothetical protein
MFTCGLFCADTVIPIPVIVQDIRLIKLRNTQCLKDQVKSSSQAVLNKIKRTARNMNLNEIRAALFFSKRHNHINGVIY